MKKDKFYAITKQDEILNADSWEELLEKTPLRKEVKMYVAFRYDKPYITSQGTGYYWPEIQILNRRNMQKHYQKGMIKVMRVKCNGTYYFKNFRFDLLNCITHNPFTVYYTNNDTFIKEPTINDFYDRLCDILSAENDKIKQNTRK